MIPPHLFYQIYLLMKAFPCFQGCFTRLDATVLGWPQGGSVRIQWMFVNSGASREVCATPPPPTTPASPALRISKEMASSVTVSKREREMFYLTTHSTHFIIWHQTYG